MSEGKKYDSEKPMMALIPPDVALEEAAAWTFGARKYDKWNWLKGIEYTRILSALERHTQALKRGEDIDPESGLHHGAHIRCCAAMLIQFHKLGMDQLDDRIHTVLKKNHD